MNSKRIPLATVGLFVAWLTHDLEELATMTDTSRALVQQFPDWMPVPASIREQGLTERYLATGIATIGLIIAAAASAATAPRAAQRSTRTHCSPLACAGSATSP